MRLRAAVLAHEAASAVLHTCRHSGGDKRKMSAYGLVHVYLPFALRRGLHLQMVTVLQTSRRDLTPARKEVPASRYVFDTAATGNNTHATMATVLPDCAKLYVATYLRRGLTQTNFV